MVDSRLRVNPPSIYHCFVIVGAPEQSDDDRIIKAIPEEFEEKNLILKSVPDFCFPCAIDYDGVQYSTYVLTDLANTFRFGFCRYPPHAKHCLCIISYFPWFHTFYGVLDKVAQINSKESTFKGITKFLWALNQQDIPAPGSKLLFSYEHGSTTEPFKVSIPDTTKLPCIPDNRNLTEYFAKVSPENMVNLFISMLFERRIIITSVKLSVLTAVVHGSVSLLYPMQWQHIYIPILPAHLIDYCCAPMPFLLGVHGSMMEKVRNMPLSEVVIFDADQNDMYMLPEDLEIFPSRSSSKLKKKLRHIDRALEDYVARQFLNSLADLIGGYREALKFLVTDQGEKIVFDDQLFLNSRTGSVRVFLEHILHLQSFRQFIAGRLELLNDDQSLEDLFENAINERCLDATSETKYTQLKEKMKKGGGALKKGGVALKKTVDGSYSQLKGMAQDIDTKEFKKKIKDKVKDGYKGVMQITHRDALGNEKRSPSPSLHRHGHEQRRKSGKQISLRVSQESIVGQPRRPPPRPPRPASEFLSPEKKESVSPPCSTSELPRKVYAEKQRTSSHSESDISSLANDSNNSYQSIRDDSFESLNAGRQTYSDTDSSNERLEGYQNPAFVDRNNDLLFSLSADEEDMALEQPPILINPQPYERHATRGPSPLASNEQCAKVITSQFENTSGPFYTPSDDMLNRNNGLKRYAGSVTRKKPVTGQKPVVPPRPRLDRSPSTPTSPTSPVERPIVPNRPASLKTKPLDTSDTYSDEISDLIFESDSSDSALNKSFLADLTFDDSFTSPHRTSTLPSADLLGLEQSLFHETMQSLSPDTRSMMDSSSSSSTSITNFQSSKAFFEQKQVYPNYNINLNNFSRSVSRPVERGKVVNSTNSELFSNYYEEPKNIKYTPR